MGSTVGVLGQDVWAVLQGFWGRLYGQYRADIILLAEAIFGTMGSGGAAA